MYLSFPNIQYPRISFSSQLIKMKLFNASFCIIFATCVCSLVLPIRVVKRHRANSTSGPRTLALYTNDDQRTLAVQDFPMYSLPTPKQEPPQNPKTKPPFRHEIVELPYPAKADGAHVTIPQSNMTVTTIRSTLLRVISTTKYWTQTRQTGHRGDTRPAIIWIKTSRGMISRFLRALELKGMPGETDSPMTLASELSSIDRELEYLRENIEADEQNQSWCIARTPWIVSQILPRLEGMIGTLEHL